MAMTTLETAAELYPNCAYIQAFLSATLSVSGDEFADASAEAYRKAMVLDPSVQKFYDILMDAMKDWKEN
jgi:hypothetical protein